MSGVRRDGVQTAERDMPTACRHSCPCAMRSRVQTTAGAAVARPRAVSARGALPAVRWHEAPRAALPAGLRGCVSSGVDVGEHLCLGPPARSARNCTRSMVSWRSSASDIVVRRARWVSRSSLALRLGEVDDAADLVVDFTCEGLGIGGLPRRRGRGTAGRGRGRTRAGRASRSCRSASPSAWRSP